jgi:hypothetical protein
MKNTADVTGGKPITVLLQSISGVSAMNSFYPLLRHPWKKERGAILLFRPGHHTRPYSFLITIKDNYYIKNITSYLDFTAASSFRFI